MSTSSSSQDLSMVAQQEQKLKTTPELPSASRGGIGKARGRNRAHLGFENLQREVSFDDLPVRGAIPLWLSGTLFRNGPAQHDLGQRRLNHWFDGLGLLQRFAFANGKVSYRNRFVRSNMYNAAKQTGKLAFGVFASDPCADLLGPMKAEYIPSGNTNVNIGLVAEKLLALGELPLAMEFDPLTLETLGVVDDKLGSRATGSAHPHRDFERQQLINFYTLLGKESTYNIFSTDRLTGKRSLISTLPIRDNEPAYMHTFGMTDNYILLAEYPLRVSLRELATGGKPFFTSFGWHPQRPTNFLVIRKSDGQLVTTLETEAFVSIHHINAFERGKGPNAELVVDLSAYDDASHLTDLYLTKRDAGTALYTGQFRRYRLPLNSSYADYEVLSSELIELPTIDYRRSNAREYRYAYGASMRSDLPEPFYNQLVKVDVVNRKSTTWFEDGCFPSEAVFVPRPGTTGEDEGVLLSIVLDTRTQSSFLLVLDAQSVTELGRAEVPVAIPYSFHGQFLSEAYSTI